MIIILYGVSDSNKFKYCLYSICIFIIIPKYPRLIMNRECEIEMQIWRDNCVHKKKNI